MSGCASLLRAAHLAGEWAIRFFSHRRGAVLLEAAIAFPVLIAILYGMVEFGVAFTVQRKNIQIAGSVADLVSQQMKPTCSQLTNIADPHDDPAALFGCDLLGSGQ